MVLIGRTSEALSRPPATNEVKFDGYSILTTPSKLDYTYGNVIVAHAAPRPGELGGLLDLWWHHFHRLPNTRPVVAFEQEGSSLPGRFDSEATELNLDLNLADVLELSRDRAMVAESPYAVTRPIRERWEWEQLETASAAEDSFGIPDLQCWLVRERRKIIEAGKGTWWGVFSGQVLEASFAAFYSESWVRFEQLRVDPRSRRTGVASLLISELTSIYSDKRIALEPLHDSWLSIMYQRLGYVPVGLTFTFVGRAE
jgi:GNAT superfamily N-acetyltransferase